MGHDRKQHIYGATHTQTHERDTKTKTKKMRSWNTSVWEAACPCRTQDYTARQRVDGTMAGSGDEKQHTANIVWS